MAYKTFQDHLAVIDTETLGVTADCVILSIGVTVSRYDDKDQTFDSLVKNGFQAKFNIKEQQARGRKTSSRVIKWWFEQSAEAKKVLVPSPEDVSLYALPEMLKKYFDSLGLDMKKVDMYDRKAFDLSKLQYLYEEDMGTDIPWRPTQEFEVATAFRFMGADRYGGIQVKDVPGAIYHCAIHDAAVDHLRLMKALHDTTND